MLDNAIPMLVQGFPNLCRIGRQYLTSNHNHHVSRRQTMLILAKTLTKQPLQRIALYRVRNLFPGDSESETRVISRFFSDQDCNTGVAPSNIVLKYLLELDRAG